MPLGLSTLFTSRAILDFLSLLISEGNEQDCEEVWICLRDRNYYMEDANRVCEFFLHCLKYDDIVNFKFLLKMFMHRDDLRAGFDRAEQMWVKSKNQRGIRFCCFTCKIAGSNAGQFINFLVDIGKYYSCCKWKQSVFMLTQRNFEIFADYLSTIDVNSFTGEKQFQLKLLTYQGIIRYLSAMDLDFIADTIKNKPFRVDEEPNLIARMRTVDANLPILTLQLAKHDNMNTLIRQLIEEGFAIRDVARRNILMLACSSSEGKNNIAPIAKQFPEMLSEQDDDGKSVVHYAAASKCVANMKELMRFLTYDHLDHQDVLGQTPLHIALQDNDYQLIEYLESFQGVG
eukprot:CAMPEP_0115008602 /NCGR_PEP_ID=MMETSP0216-20121206/22035_1 /TAXON_ID=223996 /ORGANISM="Protocruzia adherens, Strain Boccale" /LENGTH=343 /DNA_ID=CAMNT_0002376091 /DNA_START=91 /DNA_END=1122 /DNA_ORIENTATION=-